MRATSFHPPYVAPRKAAHRERWQPGVYLIKENDVLVYVGYAGECVYRTMYRHFQRWTNKSYKGGKVAPPPYRVSYRLLMDVNTYTVRVIYCSKKQAARLEKMLILKYKPRDNYMKYENYQPDAWDSRVQNKYETIEQLDYCPF